VRYDDDGEWIPPVLLGHAEERRKEMGLSVDEVLIVVSDSHVTYTQDEYNNNGKCFKRDEVTVVMDEDTNEIMTVLWNTENTYKREGTSNE